MCIRDSLCVIDVSVLFFTFNSSISLLFLCCFCTSNSSVTLIFLCCFAHWKPLCHWYFCTVMHDYLRVIDVSVLFWTLNASVSLMFLYRFVWLPLCQRRFSAVFAHWIPLCHSCFCIVVYIEYLCVIYVFVLLYTLNTSEWMKFVYCFRYGTFCVVSVSVLFCTLYCSMLLIRPSNNFVQLMFLYSFAL